MSKMDEHHVKHNGAIVGQSTDWLLEGLFKSGDEDEFPCESGKLFCRD
jgi:hypothetical protein